MKLIMQVLGVENTPLTHMKLTIASFIGHIV